MAEIELPKPEELEEVMGHKFTRRVALTTAIFAVILAISSLGGSNAMKEMILAQQQASDQWAYYQAKAGREHFYRGQKMRLELDLLEKETLKPEIRQRYATLLKEMATQEERYGNERKDIEKEAPRAGTRTGYRQQQGPIFRFRRGPAADCHRDGHRGHPVPIPGHFWGGPQRRHSRHSVRPERVFPVFSPAAFVPLR